MKIPDVIGVLRQRSFGLLYAGRTVSLIGDGMAPVAIAFAVLDLTGSAADLGIVLAARSLVLVALVLAGGVFADRIAPRRAMLVADLVRMVVMGLMAALLLTGVAEIWELAALYAIEGIATALFNPASNALVPIIVSGPERQSANALLSLSKSIGKVAGPVSAGILLALSSPGAAIAVDAATFGVSAAFLLRIVARKVRPESATSFVEDLREGWVEFSSRTWLWACVLAAAFSNAIFFPAFQVLGPTVAKESLGGSGAWALIAASYGVGAVIGGGFGLAVRTRRVLLLAETVVLFVVLPLALLAVGANAFAIAAGAFLAGAALSLSEILYETAIQQHVPPAAMARVSAYDWFGSLAIQPISFALVGSIAAGIGISTLLWLEAGLLVVTQGAVLMVPSVRKLQSLPPREEVDWPAELSPVAPGD